MVQIEIGLKELVKKQVGFLVIIVFFIVIQISITSIFPYLTKIIIDNILRFNNHSEFNRSIMLVTVLIAIQIPTNIALSYFSAKWIQEIVFDLRNRIGLGFVNSKENSGTNGLFINSILSDCDTIGTQLLSLLINGIPNILLVIICFCLLLILNVKLTLIICMIIPFFLLVSILSSKVIYKLSRNIQETRDMLVQFLNAHVRNKLIIDLYGMRTQEYVNFKSHAESIKDLNIYSNTILSFFSNISGLITTVTPILCLFIGGYMVINDEITLGELIAFNSYVSLIFSPLSKLLSMPPVYSQMKVSLDRLNSLNFEDINKYTGIYIREPLYKNGHLKVSGLIPYLNHEPLSIQEISFLLQRGDILRLNGKNGVGKSLILKCLVEYHSDFKGEITVQQNSKISYIPQENYLFEGTVYDNLTMGLHSISKIELSNYCDMLNFDVELSTKCSPFKMNLSTGQMQKIKIIRALLGHPHLLLLDESLSNLDNSSIKRLLVFLRKKNITIIFIHHGSVSDFLEKSDFSTLWVTEKVCS